MNLHSINTDILLQVAIELLFVPLAESEDEQEFALTLHERETAITYSVSDTAPVVEKEV